MDKNTEQVTLYGIGRFVIEIPSYMEYKSGSHTMTLCSLEEIMLPSEGEDATAQLEWKKRLEQVESLEPPQGRNAPVIDIKTFPDIGDFSRGVFYYGDVWMPDTGYWDIFMKKGSIGLWVKTKGDYENNDTANKNKMAEIALHIANAYRAPTQRFGHSTVIKGIKSFYLQYGAIDLPFNYDESLKVYFKGHPLDEFLEFVIETKVVDEVVNTGLTERLSAIESSKLVPGLKMKKIRGRKRIAAGLGGEEIVILGIDKETNESQYAFVWEYHGEKVSAYRPWVKISMNSGDSNEEEKLALWDAVLDSMQPAGR